MSRREGSRLAWGLVCALGTAAAGQSTLYVNGACGDDAWSGTSEICEDPDGPKATIQAAQDAAPAGAEVVVEPGVYRGAMNKSLVFGGESVRLRGASAGPTPVDLDGGARFLDDPDAPETGDAGGRGLPVFDMGAFERVAACAADFDGNGGVNTLDVLAFLNAWNAGC